MFASVWEMMKRNKFEFDNEISSELICRICKCLMIKACNAPCGCRFCSDCIEHYLDGTDKFCPGAAKHCGKKMINFNKDVSEDHATNLRISEAIVKCSMQNCQFKDELEVMESHMRTCNKQPISCPFNRIGCEMNEVEKDEMKVHLNENNEGHSKLLIDQISNLYNEMRSMRDENVKLREEIININVKLCNIERREAENRVEIEELNEEMVALKNENRSLRMEMETTIESINQIRHQIEVIESKCQQQIDEMKEKSEQRLQLENEKLEMAKCANEIRQIETKLGSEKYINYGFFECQIDKFSQQKRDELIYSEAFYSGPIGYKMCLWVLIWGDCVHVGFCVMRGANDEQLDWPFNQSVAIDVIDPANGSIYMSKSLKYSDRPRDASGWVKPSDDRNDPIWIHGYDYSIYKLSAKSDKLLLRCRIEKFLQI